MVLKLSAQTMNLDTLQQVKQLAYAKEYAKALSILKMYRSRHTENISALRLNLTILYWDGQIDQTRQGYESALKKYPEAYGLRLDYARFLYELNDLNKAREQLEEVIKSDTVNLEAKTLLGIIYYWHGKPKEARVLLNKVLEKKPDDLTVRYFLSEINAFLAPYLTMKSGYYSDQQPIKKIVSTAESGIYYSKELSPYLKVQTQQFLNTHANTSILAGNRSRLFHSTLTIDISAGFTNFPSTGNSIKWMGGVIIAQKITRNLSLGFLAEHKPYFYTLSSLQTPVTESDYFISLSWGRDNTNRNSKKVSFWDLKNWNGKANAGVQNYMDANTVQSAYAWVMCPSVVLNKLNIRLGYSYSFNNTQSLRYTSALPLNTVLSEWTSQSSIKGIYNPYFTPIHQQINALIGSVSYSASKSLQFLVKGNIGFNASAQAPYIYLQKNGSGETDFDTGLAYKKYTPFQINASATWVVSPRLTLETSYTYTRAFFFDSQLIDVGLTYRFIHE